jgi:hypothetical protein
VYTWSVAYWENRPDFTIELNPNTSGQILLTTALLTLIIFCAHDEIFIGEVLELADRLDLGSSAARREGSSPSFPIGVRLAGF